MDRKIISILAVACALCCLAALPLAANAATVYDGTISTTYITIFRDIATKLSLTDSYLFFRSGQYEYMMVAGELSFNGSMFTGTNLTAYILTSNSGYNNTYSYGTTVINDFSLAPGGALVYSNLGSYPDLFNRSDYSILAILFAIALAFCCFLIRSIFDFNMRLGESK